MEVQGKPGIVWFRDSKDAGIFVCLWVSVDQVCCSLYWSYSEADSSLRMRKITVSNFQSASLAIWGRMGKNSAGYFLINAKILGSHWTSIGCMPNPESSTEAKGIGYINGQAGGSYDCNDWWRAGQRREASLCDPHGLKAGKERHVFCYWKKTGSGKSNCSLLHRLLVIIFWIPNASLVPRANSSFLWHWS